MAVTVMLETPYGETRTTYVRINSVSTNNHGVSSSVLFRGYINREAFKAAAAYTWEKEIEIILDISEPLWPSIYAALKNLPEFSQAEDC